MKKEFGSEIEKANFDFRVYLLLLLATLASAGIPTGIGIKALLDSDSSFGMQHASTTVIQPLGYGYVEGTEVCIGEKAFLVNTQAVEPISRGDSSFLGYKTTDQHNIVTGSIGEVVCTVTDGTQQGFNKALDTDVKILRHDLRRNISPIVFPDDQFTPNNTYQRHP